MNASRATLAACTVAIIAMALAFTATANRTPPDFLLVSDRAEFLGGLWDIYLDGIQAPHPGFIEGIHYQHNEPEIRWAIDEGKGSAGCHRPGTGPGERLSPGHSGAGLHIAARVPTLKRQTGISVVYLTCSMAKLEETS